MQEMLRGQLRRVKDPHTRNLLSTIPRNQFESIPSRLLDNIMEDNPRAPNAGGSSAPPLPPPAPWTSTDPHAQAGLGHLVSQQVPGVRVAVSKGRLGWTGLG